MFRGKDEAKIEKDLSRFPDLAQATVRGLFLGMDIFLAATDNSRDRESGGVWGGVHPPNN